MKRIFFALVAICATAVMASAEVPEFLPRLTRNTSDMIFNGIRETPRDYYRVLAGIEMYQYDDLSQQGPVVVEGEYEYARKKKCIDVRLDFSCLTVSGGCHRAYIDYIFSSDKKELQKVVMTITGDSLSWLEKASSDFFWTAHCMTKGLIEQDPRCWEGDDVVFCEPTESEKFALRALDEIGSPLHKYAFSMTIHFSDAKK